MNYSKRKTRFTLILLSSTLAIAVSLMFLQHGTSKPLEQADSVLAFVAAVAQIIDVIGNSGR